MQLFTKTYHPLDLETDQQSLILADFVLDRVRGSFFIGHTPRGGYLCFVDEQGKPGQSTEYVFSQQRIYFYKALYTSQGNIAVLAYHKNGNARLTAYVLNLDSRGQFLSAEQLTIPNIRFLTAFLLLPNDELVIVGWFTPPSSRSDKVFAYKVGASAPNTSCQVYQLGKDDQLGCALYHDGGIHLFGSQHSPALRGFHIELDVNLNPVISNYKYAGDISILAIHDTCPSPINEQNLLATFREGNSQSVGILTLRPRLIAMGKTPSVKFEWAGKQLRGRSLERTGAGYTMMYSDQDGKYYVASLDEQLKMFSNTRLDFHQSALRGLAENLSPIYFYGNLNNNQVSHPLLIKSNALFDSCKTVNEELLTGTPFDFTPGDAELSHSTVEVQVAQVAFLSNAFPLIDSGHCADPEPDPGRPFQLMESYRLQSSALYLGAAGCQGVDAARGIHLRWFLNGFLGENHLPKGDYSSNTDFFNRKGDFVHLYRIPYTQSDTHSIRLDVSSQPDRMDHSRQSWLYQIGTFQIRCVFLDANRYEQITTGPNAPTDASGILQAYGNGILEFSLLNALAFRVELTPASNTRVKLESFSVPDSASSSDSPAISSRKTFTPNSQTNQVLAENIQTIRLSVQSGEIQQIAFELYAEVLQQAMQARTMEYLGAFALSLDDNVVDERLEDSNTFQVHDAWNKFNDGARVNTNTYRQRWSDPHSNSNPDYGLKWGVEQYLQKSETDPSATGNYGEETDSYNEASMDISLLSFLNLATLDFHVARMLGLGTIDASGPVLEEGSYLYVAEYMTNKHIEDYSVLQNTQHLYISLPTSVLTERLPQQIELDFPTYGLTVDNGTDEGMLITDADGYAPFEQVRYVNLRARLRSDHQISNGFFNPAIEFESSQYTTPVFWGLENRKDTESQWRKPEIAHHATYQDTQGLAETQGILFNPDNPKAHFVHEITEEGKDVFAGYAINKFSRASGLSPEIRTDHTKFITANTLKAPVNIMAQLIQAENPLLLTTATEQGYLQAIDPGMKKILLRLDFDYTDVQDKQYNFGNKVALYYRPDMPRNVIGSILTVIDNPNDASLCTLKTGDYTYISTGETLIPKIDDHLRSHFVGANLTYRSKTYQVQEVIQTQSDGNYPDLVVQKIESRDAVPVAGARNQLLQSYEAILTDPYEAFLLVENLSPAANWTNGLSTSPNRFPFDIDLAHDNWAEREESYLDDAGNPVSETVKGIWDDAVVALDTMANEPHIYTLSCENVVLPSHPQQADITDASHAYSVVWHGGKVRLHVKGDTNQKQQRKTLDILKLEQIGGPGTLIITASDPAYDTIDPDQNIEVGATLSVNIHPGYRVYLKEEAGIHFDQVHLLPAEHEGTRYGLLGLQTLDDTTLDKNGDAYASSISVPAMFFARELITPLAPRLPIGPLYATKPDVYHKATYSFTTEFEHKPWGLVYYRIELSQILASLYEPATIRQIREQLPSLLQDDQLEERWEEVLSFDYTANGGEFGSFEINEAGDKYQLPWPDRKDLLGEDANGNANPPQKPGDVVDLIMQMIYSNLLPLTEQPLIMQYMKGGTYVPQAHKQKIKDAAGKILAPGDPAFDQSPMAKRISDTKVLFTDFSLDSNMSSETAYFYVVREMSNSMQLGPPSPFLGPVQLVNTKAPDPLVIQKVLAPLPGIRNNYRTVVQFHVLPFSPHQDISRIEILRTQESIDSLHVRRMEVVKRIPISDLILDQGILIIEDDFEHDQEIPYSTPLYYRLRGVREISFIDAHKQPQTIDVYSTPTDVFMSNVLDMERPKSPEISIDKKILSSNPDQIDSLTLSWEKVCVNGTYRLFYLNAINNWEELQSIQTNVEGDLVCDVTNLTGPLDKLNDDDLLLHHKFRVSVENTSGLMNEGQAYLIPWD